MKKTKVAPVCIAGAHRSGTSMLTRLLREAGLELGPASDMMPAQADNPDGFWENLRFVRINDEVLNELGGAWDVPPAATEDFTNPRLQPSTLKATVLIESFASGAIWGWKDPRNSLTLPFWKPLIPELKVVVMVRNPLEVAYSMHKRNGTSYAFGLRLWELYNRRLLATTGESPRLIANYDAFFENPEHELRRVARFIGLPEDRIPAAILLVAQNRRHTSFNLEQLMDARVAPEIIELYRDMIAGKTSEDGTAANDVPENSRIPTGAGPEFLPGAPNRLNIAVPDREGLREELAALRGAKLEYERLLHELPRLRQIAQQEGRIQELQEGLSAKERELGFLRDRFSQLKQLLQSHDISLAAHDRRLRQQLSATERLVWFLDRTVAAAARLRRSRRWRLSNPIPTLRNILFGRPLLGPGDLERVVDAYAQWKPAHPEIMESEATLQELPPLPEPWDAADLPSSFTPPVPTKPIKFPVHEEVEISIVIPVFNQLSFTRACLAAIQEHAGSERFEVIVVDDCSDDGTADEISRLPGIVYLRNEANAGFVVSCNWGARKARGDYLVFLNNDTQVTAGWLSALRETFALHPRAGLVGGKLLFPNGRLQEAGGIIWRDASGANYGKNDDPDEPQYNYVREVDYCSGACIMIPRALFEELGTFDPALAPAYYEDTDLAFKVRAAGHQVFYQPQAAVIHYEGLSCGTSTDSGVKSFQRTNQVKFRDKWREALDLHADGRNADVDRSKDRGVTRRVLVADTRILCPDRDSGSLRMLNLLRIFQQLGFKVTFLPDNRLRPSPYTERMQQLGIECLYHPFIGHLGDFLRQRGGEFDLIVLSRMEIGQKMLADCRAAAPSTPIIFDTVDLHFLRKQREAELSDSDDQRRAAAAMRASELEIASRCDAVVVVSSFEKQLLEEELPETRVAIISNIHETRPAAPPLTGRRDLVFIGGFEHPPNIDAMTWFCTEIMPGIVAQIPEAILHIIGSNMPGVVRALASANVITHGYVEDVQPFFDSCLLSVAPLRYGAGVKGKINQSMSLGVPVVSTSVGAEGMHLEHERNILIADEPRDFAAAVVRLHRDPSLWDRLSQGGLVNVDEHFSFSAAKENLLDLLQRLNVLPPAPDGTTYPRIPPSPTNFASIAKARSRS